MPITRDADYPEGPATLFQAFNHCSDGHSMDDVIEAAANLLIAGLTNFAKAKGLTATATDLWARDICRNVVKGVANNFAREQQPTDIEVKPQ